jgi:hypothetical protein
MKLRTTMLAAGVAAMAAACTQSPTATGDPARRPSGPGYDGLMYGSGNLVSGTTRTGGRTASGDSVQVASVQRGGLMYGSGN